MNTEEAGAVRAIASREVDSGDRPMGPLARYLATTRGLGYSVMFALPLALLYELGIAFTTKGDVRIGADVWIRGILSMIGLGDTLFLAGLFVVVAAIVVMLELRRGLRFNTPYFAGMFAESIIYALASGALVKSVVEALVPMQWPPRIQTTGGLSISDQLVLSLGAGFYEELVFRLILVSALAGLLTVLARKTRIGEERLGRRLRYVIAAIVGALIFSWVHYTGALGDEFQLASFSFRFLMGLALNAIFLWRGFGIAAMTHALYDVVVTVMQ